MKFYRRSDRVKLIFKGVLCSLLVILTLCISVSAQEEPPLLGPPTATPVLALDIKEVIPALEESKSLVRKGTELATNFEAIKAVSNSVVDLQSLVNSYASEIELTLNNTSVTFDKRKILLEKIREARSKLAEANIVLNNRVNQLVNMRTEISSKLDLWRKTQNSIKKEGGETLISQIRALSAAFTELDTELNSQLKKVLLEQGKVSTTSNYLDEAIDKINKLNESTKKTIFIRDAGFFFTGQSTESLIPSFEWSWKKDLSDIVNYFLINRDKLILFAVITALFVWLTIASANSEMLLKINPTIHNRPYSMLFGAILFLATIFFSDALQSFLLAARVLFVLPLIRIASSVFEKRYRSTVFFSLIPFVLGLFDIFFTNAETARAILRTIVLISTAYAYLKISRSFKSAPRDIPDLKHDRLSGLLSWLVGVGAMATLALAGAYIIGYWSLASYIGTALVQGLFFGGFLIVLYWFVIQSIKGIGSATSLNKASFVNTNSERLIKVISLFIALILIGVWFKRFFSTLSLEQNVAVFFNQVFGLPVGIGRLKVELGSLIMFFATAIVGLWTAKSIRSFLEQDVYPRSKMDRGAQHAFSITIHYLILIAFGLASLVALGVSFQSLTIITGALSVGAGIGLQQIVGNIVSGIIILYERPIKIGDLVTIQGVLGNVSRINLRSTTIRSADDAEIIIPNSKIISEQITNFTHSSIMGRVNLTIFLAPEIEVVYAKEILLETLRGVSSLIQSPSPDVHFRGYKESGLEFQLGGWIRDVSQKFSAENEVWMAISKTLETKKLAVSFPRREINVRTVS